MSTPAARPPESTSRAALTMRLPATIVTVSPDTLKLVLERLGYTATATNWACWAMTRDNGTPVMLPRLGHRVATEILQATADRVGVTVGLILELGGDR